MKPDDEDDYTDGFQSVIQDYREHTGRLDSSDEVRDLRRRFRFEDKLLEHSVSIDDSIEDSTDYHRFQEDRKRAQTLRHIADIRENIEDRNVEGLKLRSVEASGFYDNSLRHLAWPVVIRDGLPDKHQMKCILEMDCPTSPRLTNGRDFGEALKLENLGDSIELCSARQQVELDVRRTVGRFATGLKDETKRQFEDRLLKVVCRILIKFPELNYYQGYHDVCLTFLLVNHEQDSTTMLEAITMSHFKEYMEATMENTTKILRNLMPLVHKLNVEVATHMHRSRVGEIFALSWLITWLSHDINDIYLIARFYDVFICRHRYFPLYVSAAIISKNAVKILNTECDMADLHPLLSRLPNFLTAADADQIVEDAVKLDEEFPVTRLPGILSEWEQYSATIKSKDEDKFANYQMVLERQTLDNADMGIMDTLKTLARWSISLGISAFACVLFYKSVQESPSVLLDDFLSLIYGSR